MEKALETVVEAVKVASPALWAAAQQKVRANMLSDWTALLLSIIIILAAFLLVRKTQKIADKHEGYDRYGAPGWLIPAAVGGWVAGVTALLVGIVSIFDLVQLYNAPDWYAIKALMQLTPWGK